MVTKSSGADQKAAAATTSTLSAEEARRIVTPLYDALNQPAKKHVASLLAEATNPDYRSYHTNEEVAHARPIGRGVQDYWVCCARLALDH